MHNYNQKLASKDDIATMIYYKNPNDIYKLLNVYVWSIDGDTVWAKRGINGAYKTHTKGQLFKYINLGCFSYEAP